MTTGLVSTGCTAADAGMTATSVSIGTRWGDQFRLSVQESVPCAAVHVTVAPGSMRSENVQLSLLPPSVEA